MGEINDSDILILELKNKIDRLMEEYKASFYTHVDKDGHVRLTLGPCTEGSVDSFVTMLNTKSKCIEKNI